jgi:uncharacterized protein YecE (DUF72 family)
MPSNNRVFRIGTSGWSYRGWVGMLYPQEMPPAEYLTEYARHFDTVEIESTWYEFPTKHTVQAWYRRTPDGFRFSPCMPRSLTDEQRSEEIAPLLHTFLEVITELGDKLGPMLIQLPAQWRVSEQPRLEALLDLLPSDLAFAIEFRHGSWLKETTYQLLEAYGVAWVIVDAPFLPRVARVTAPFAYVRWHGHPSVGQRSRHRIDTAASLRPWLSILRDVARHASHVYGYVRNSFSGYAPRDCETLLRLLGEVYPPER